MIVHRSTSFVADGGDYGEGGLGESNVREDGCLKRGQEKVEGRCRETPSPFLVSSPQTASCTRTLKLKK